MGNHETAMSLMQERFGKDTLIAVATSDGERMFNRMVDALYVDGAFYITTYALSNKIKQIQANPAVAVCSHDWFTGHGEGKNLGWVKAPENAEIRGKLRDAFSEWYDHANNEDDQNCCILQIRLTDGMLIKDHNALRYLIDFDKKTTLLSENWGEFK